MARKSEYNRKYHKRWIEGLAMMGCTDDEIASQLGITRKTLYNWVKGDEELLHAIKRGKSYADTNVEMSLYKRACGYSKEDTRSIIEVDKTTGETLPARIETNTIEVPPETAACCFWLKNRKPKEWRDRIEKDVDVNVGARDLTADEAAELMQKLHDRIK